MSNISAAMVKELREKTGAGMLDCKKALTEAEGNMDKAVETLRKKGIAKAAKKSTRVAAEGLVVATTNGKEGVLLEFNTETDFSAKNDSVISLASKLADVALANGTEDVETLKEIEIDGNKAGDMVTEIIAKIGENMNVRRIKIGKAPNGFVTVYSHLGGKIGVMLELEGDFNPENEVKAKDIAMHVAAMDPKFLTKEEVSTETLEKEKEIEKVKLLKEGKPENIIEKILVGKMNKFYEENCLLQQKFVKDDKFTVEQYAGNLKVLSYTRFKLGEGIEKEEVDFAAEVAAQVAGK